jgi:hypothetical protein
MNNFAYQFLSIQAQRVSLLFAAMRAVRFLL